MSYQENFSDALSQVGTGDSAMFLLHALAVVANSDKYHIDRKYKLYHGNDQCYKILLHGADLLANFFFVLNLYHGYKKNDVGTNTEI